MAVIKKYCFECKAFVETPHNHRDKNASKAYDKFFRDKETSAFYHSSAWKKVRKLFLIREPFCRECGQPASDVDHIVPIRSGGAKLNFSNLQALCKACHTRKTLRERA